MHDGNSQEGCAYDDLVAAWAAVDVRWAGNDHRRGPFASLWTLPDLHLDDLATALYVSIDDYLLTHPELLPDRPRIGIAPKLSDAELVTLALMQALLGFTSEARWLRHAHRHLRSMFPSLPATASAYNKRLRKATGLMTHLIAVFAGSCPSYSDDVWPVDSTPVEGGRSRETGEEP